MAATTGSIGDCTRPPGTNDLDILVNESAGTADCQSNSMARAPRVTLSDLLSNSLVLRQTAPYIPVATLCALMGTSWSVRQTIKQSSDATRYLNLSTVHIPTLDDKPLDGGGISWRNERMDEALTEDEFYSGPLRGVMSRLSRQDILSNISTMILDGLTVPAEVVREIISEDRFSVRILSIREAKHLNERKLMLALKYAVRPTRPKGMPKLRGLYVFGPMERAVKGAEPDIGRRRSPTRYPDSSPSGVMDALGAQLGAEWNEKSKSALKADLHGVEDKWYQPTGLMFKKTPASDWADTLQACEGIIHFDAVLCRGPRHDPQAYANQDPDIPTNPHNAYIPPTIATVALGPHGCSKCESSPEGPACFGSSPSHHLPLLSPPPLHSSSIRAAQWPHSLRPTSESPKLYVRCKECLKHRWCERCGKWWDEKCYMPGHTRTELQDQEFVQWQMLSTAERPEEDIKVHMGFCVQNCLMEHLMVALGEGGMWG